MTVVRDDFSAAALAGAVEENGAEFLMTMGRAGGGEERDDDKLRWTIGGSPIDYHNAVVAANLDATDADAAIDASLATLRAHRVPGSWHLGPGMSPADLGQRLVDRGFIHAGDDIGMAVELHGLQPLLLPAGLAISRVRTPDDLAAWVKTLGKGFGEGPEETEWVGEIFANLGLEHASGRHYLGRLDGEPVATATLFLGARVAGISFVFTVPEARHRGIGAALTMAPLLEARALGYRISVLGASMMGEPVYRRLGFREYCRIGLFEWREGEVSFPPGQRPAPESSQRANGVA